ncbi:MAG: YihA family ribosome biogenesis GTP-binding protein [Chitinophagaceae bacterium]|nr:YihA family ribosome biogenesis GTP-binding protein [Chitinophagaceae bacterium]
MEITSAKYIKSSPSLQDCPRADLPEYAFIGRSNVGKSSLINMIANNEKLAKTSRTPGKTQLINHFLFSGQKANGQTQSWYVVDLPGYGFAKRSIAQRNEWQRMIDHYVTGRKNLMQIFLLVDSRHNPQKPDIDFAQKLYSLQIPYTIIFTKSDKENQRTVHQNIQSFLKALSEYQQFLPQQITTSSTKKTGRKKLIDLIKEMNEAQL